MHKQLLFVILLFTVIFNGFSQEGKLSKAKESLTSSSTTNTSSSSSSNSKSKRNTRVSNDDDESYFGSFFAGIFIKLFAYTAYGVAIESPWEMKGRMHDAEIAYYPYKNNKYGNFIYTNTTNYALIRFDVYNHFFIENNNLYGNDLGVDVKFLKRFSLDMNYTTLQEKIANKNDSFNLFSALLKYHRIRTQRLDAWFGLGFRSVFNNVNETRFLLGFGGEIFIGKPISLAGSHKWATVNQQSVRNTKLHLKYHIKNYRITTGYEQYVLGVSKINAFSMGVEASF